VTGKSNTIILPRRRILQGIAASTGGLLVSGCDVLNESAPFRAVLQSAETLNFKAQRLITDRGALAREFTAAEMSPTFRANGSVTGDTAEYKSHALDRFANWRLVVDGLVARPLALSMAQLMAMPSREQITRHDCVEGWSAIGKWRGTPLRLLLQAAGLSSKARFLVFHCADRFDGLPYYESVDLVDGFHPQTMLAWGMNGGALPERHGAPLRLRVERQLGYKQAKFVMRVQAVSSLAQIGAGKGGYWEDVADYQWYAGI
jgi:DMSO/TMAO reductase YedYZ molybdopterin-dependent catalytic subunit